jgi:F-type H+-transporting ATPase subunit epsilon
MSGILKIRILTPEKEFYNGEIIELVSENELGKFGILPNHIAMITTLKPSITTFKTTDGKKLEAFISTGVLKVNNNEVEILCDACEWPEDIDINRAEEAEARAIAILQKKNRGDIKRAEIAMARALLRIKIKKM